MNDLKTKDLTKMGIVSALVFLMTYIIKIPVPNGYTHLGDCMIFIGVLILGWKRGAIASGIGAGLADYIGGFVQWVLPTFIIKAAMAAVMGLIAEKLFPKFKFGWLIGAVIGGIVQIVGYTFAEGLMYGFMEAILNSGSIVFQTTAGVVLAAVAIQVLNSSGVMKMVKEI